MQYTRFICCAISTAFVAWHGGYACHTARFPMCVCSASSKMRNGPCVHVCVCVCVCALLTHVCQIGGVLHPGFVCASCENWGSTRRLGTNRPLHVQFDIVLRLLTSRLISDGSAAACSVELLIRQTLETGLWAVPCSSL